MFSFQSSTCAAILLNITISLHKKQIDCVLQNANELIKN